MVDEGPCADPGAARHLAGLHHHLIRPETRTNVGIVLESAEPRQVHHFCTLILGYGATAIYPYLAYETLHHMARRRICPRAIWDARSSPKHYIKAAVKGILKVISKMGISTLQESYHGAQIFEAIGIKKEVVDRYFTWTASRIEGVGMEEIAQEAVLRHETAFGPKADGETAVLDTGGDAAVAARRGVPFLYNPEDHPQAAERLPQCGDYEMYKEFSGLIYGENQELCTLRGLLEFNTQGVTPIPIEEVESVECQIVKRFKTGAMSYGSLSRKAHEALAIAMNRLGGQEQYRGGRGGHRPLPPLTKRRQPVQRHQAGGIGPVRRDGEYLTNCRERYRSRWPREPSPARADSSPAARSIPGDRLGCGTPPREWG